MLSIVSHRPCAANILLKILLIGASRVDSFWLNLPSPWLPAHHCNARLDYMHRRGVIIEFMKVSIKLLLSIVKNRRWVIIEFTKVSIKLLL